MRQAKYILAGTAGGFLIGAPYYFPPESLLAFVPGWFLCLQLVLAAYLVIGFLIFMKNRRRRIMVVKTKL